MNRIKSCHYLNQHNTVNTYPISTGIIYSGICHCKPVHKKNISLLNKLFGNTKSDTITLSVSQNSLISLYKTYIDKCHILKISKTIYYIPKLNQIGLYKNQKIILYKLDSRDNKHRQDHLFCLSKNNSNLCKYLRNIGYDIDISNTTAEILYKAYHKNYSIIWLDRTTLTELQIFHIIFILRVMYKHKNTIIIIHTDIDKFQKKTITTNFKLRKTNSPGFYQFDYLNYIWLKTLVKEIAFSKDVDTSNQTEELLVQSNISRENVATYLNNKFYIGCCIINPQNLK